MTENFKYSVITKEFFDKVKMYADMLKDISDTVSVKQGYNPSILEKIRAADDRLTHQCKQLEEELGKQNPEISRAKEVYKNLIRPWYNKSWFMHMAMTKPRGYPGDYEIIDAIYNNLPKSKGGIGYYLDIHFLNKPLAIAIRERISIIENMVTNEINNHNDGIDILNLASGALREWYLLLPNVKTAGIKLINIDHDQEALNYSGNRLNQIKGRADIQFIRDGALRFGLRKKEQNIDRYGLFNLVYSVGLYDYIPDRVLVKILEANNALLYPDGKQIIAFKNRDNYDPTNYDWVADWKFIPRRESEIDVLLSEVGVRIDIVEKLKDSTGTIIFYKLHKFDK